MHPRPLANCARRNRSALEGAGRSSTIARKRGLPSEQNTVPNEGRERNHRRQPERLFPRLTRLTGDTKLGWLVVSQEEKD